MIRQVLLLFCCTTACFDPKAPTAAGTDTEASESGAPAATSTGTTAAAAETDDPSSTITDGGDETAGVDDTGTSTNESTTDSSESGSPDASSSEGSECMLVCAADEECIDGHCVDPDAAPIYGACLDVADGCQIGECIYDGSGATVCAVECESVEDCPEGPPGSTVACGSLTGGDISHCYLECVSCPAGMQCVDDLACQWPA